MNDFDLWNLQKQKIEKDSQGLVYFPHEGEVWISSLGKNIGFEQNGNNVNFSRPVLIVKKFNNQMFLAVPLSTKQKRLDFYYNYTDVRNRKVSAILAQLRLISTKRLDRKLYTVSKLDLSRIKMELGKFFV